MRGQPGQHVVGILPDRFRHNERGFWVKLSEHFHAFPLGSDEPVLEMTLVGVTPNHAIALGLDGCGQRAFHGLLGRPAHLVGRQAKIATGNQQHGFGAHGPGIGSCRTTLGFHGFLGGWIGSGYGTEPAALRQRVTAPVDVAAVEHTRA